MLFSTKPTLPVRESLLHASGCLKATMAIMSY
ncbi:hypothetical protein [Mesorhizobium sp.]|nr:MAG: hypothetical protein EOQ78_29555 [Mesorhizobium sp.]